MKELGIEPLGRLQEVGETDPVVQIQIQRAGPELYVQIEQAHARGLGLVPGREQAGRLHRKGGGAGAAAGLEEGNDAALPLRRLAGGQLTAHRVIEGAVQVLARNRLRHEVDHAQVHELAHVLQRRLGRGGHDRRVGKVRL